MPNLSGFDAATIEPATAYEALPAGDYLAMITESEMKPTKSGSGEYLQLTYKIIGDEGKGRMVWARLNLSNPNTVAVEIAKKELSAICRAVGVLKPQDSADLHDIPHIITLEVGAYNGKTKNEVIGYKPAAPAAAPAPVAPAKREPAPAAATGSAPWAR